MSPVPREEHSLALSQLRPLLIAVAYQYPRLRLLESELPDAIADEDFAQAENNNQLSNQ